MGRSFRVGWRLSPDCGDQPVRLRTYSSRLQQLIISYCNLILGYIWGHQVEISCTAHLFKEYVVMAENMLTRPGQGQLLLSSSDAYMAVKDVGLISSFYGRRSRAKWQKWLGPGHTSNPMVLRCLPAWVLQIVAMMSLEFATIECPPSSLVNSLVRVFLLASTHEMCYYTISS